MMLKWYQAAARETAVYPERYRIAYPCLGLVGEIGEFLAARGHGDEVMREAGDVSWYCANLCSDLGKELRVGVSQVPARSLSQLGQLLAERTKKILRDGDGGAEDVVGLVGEVMAVIAELGLAAVLEGNIRKLRDRQARGVLGGSGDHR